MALKVKFHADGEMTGKPVVAGTRTPTVTHFANQGKN
jgi:hypothetical protein